MNTRSLRALAFAMLAGASLSQAGFIDYRGSDVPRNFRGTKFWMYFLVIEHDSTRAKNSTDIVVGEKLDITPDPSGQYSAVIGKIISVPNVLKPGNGLYISIAIPGGDTILDRRLRLVERTEDCQSVWSLDGMGAPAKAGDNSAISPVLTVPAIPGQKTSTTTTDPSLGLASISGLGELVGGSPIAVAATPAASANQAASSQAAVQSGASQMGPSKGCPDAEAVGASRSGSDPVAGAVEIGTGAGAIVSPAPSLPENGALLPATGPIGASEGNLSGELVSVLQPVVVPGGTAISIAPAPLLNSGSESQPIQALDP